MPRGEPASAGLIREHGELIAQGVQGLRLQHNAGAGGGSGAARIGAGAWEHARLRRNAGACRRLCARSFWLAWRRSGVVGCGKHFPGLGGGALDSHLETPVIRRSRPNCGARIWRPITNCAMSCRWSWSIMRLIPRRPARIVPPAYRRIWITTVLRKRIGYGGIIFSDDHGDGRNTQVHAASKRPRLRPFAPGWICWRSATAGDDSARL